MSEFTEWQEHKVMQLQREGILLVEDGNHGEYRPRTEEFGLGEVSFIRATDMDAGQVLFDSAARINTIARERIRKGIGAGGDVLLSHKGTVGKLAFVPINAPKFVCSPQTTFWRSLDQNRLDRRYLYYYLCSEEFTQQLASRKGETDMADYVSLTAQRDLTVLTPPIMTQRAIARILGALDDKIELNRRMNRTLESMVQSLFRSWFVDFEPVSAKREGRNPVGMNEATAALFPEHFQETNIGPIPVGWRIASIYDAAEVIYGAPFASALFNSNADGKPLIRIRDLVNESPSVFTTEAHPKGYMVQPGDIVVGMDGEFRAYLWGGTPSWLNQRVCVFAPKPPFSSPFVRCSVIPHLAEVEATETATTVIHLGKNDIERFKVIDPGVEVLKAFNCVCQPCYDRIVKNKQQSRILAAQRDALLPQLLSGELKVVQAEEMA